MVASLPGTVSSWICRYLEGGAVIQIMEASSNLWWHPSQVQLGSLIGRYLDRRVVSQNMEASSNMWWHPSQVQLISWIGRYMYRMGCARLWRLALTCGGIPPRYS